MIRVIRNIGNEEGKGAFRTWCDDCRGYCQGQGRARHVSWWLQKAGAVKAAQRHQDQHAAHIKGSHMFGLADDRDEPNAEEWQEVSSLPCRPTG